MKNKKLKLKIIKVNTRCCPCDGTCGHRNVLNHLFCEKHAPVIKKVIDEK